jgi:MoxR-like ATPase
MSVISTKAISNIDTMNPNIMDTKTMSNDQELAAINRMRLRLNTLIKGKPEVIEQVIICLLARGHLLLEDKPGLGKTTLAKGLSEAIGGKFARIQCTPDLLPSDITGFNIYNQKLHEFEYRPGPVFSDVLLADEINRATPRTQSALLEAMAERQVTVDTVRYQLSSEFFVIATQNPIEQHGTYPLPEAQLDRFATKLSIGYPSAEDEVRVLQSAIKSKDGIDEEAEEFMSAGELRLLQEKVSCLYVEQSIQRYLVEIARATRSHRQILLGTSPRGLLIWQAVIQARAFLQGRSYVTPEDVQEMAVPVLSVRLGTETGQPEHIIREILDTVPIPT